VKLTLYYGDCMKIMQKMKNNVVDAVITDPPYNISQENKVISRRNLSSSMHRRNADIKLDFGKWDRFDEQEYYKFTESWFREIARILKPKGWFASFFSKERTGWFTDPLGGLFVKYGFEAKTIITWHKTNPVPQFRKVNFLSSTEFIVVGSKGKSKIPNFYEQKNMHNFYETPNSSIWKKTSHPTEKPIELMKWLVSILSHEDDTILDPFLGSGTTMEACLNLKRNCIGIEKNPKYVDMVKNRLNWDSTLSNVEFEFFEGSINSKNVQRGDK